jgi:hypothetical protein
MSYNLEIKRALTLSFNTILLAYDVKWPNSNFTTPNAKTWLEFKIMTGELFEQTLTDTDRINGIVQIDVFMQKLKGENDAFIVADLLNSQLPKNNSPIVNGITKVFIRTITPPKQTDDDNWHRMSIDVSFYAFVPR